MKIFTSLLILLIQGVFILNAQTTSGAPKKLVCYYTNWSQYRAGLGRFVPENVDAELCTHVVYAFARLDENGLLQPFEWNDIDNEWSRGMYAKIMDLKKKNKDLKISLAAGGWNFGSGPFSTLVHDEQARKNFVNNSVEYLLKYGFDGFDIVWEYPGSREGSQDDDKQYFTLLIKELKKAFETNNLLLSAAVDINVDTIEKGYEIDQLSEYLDFINVMAYDFHKAQDDYIGANAPLYPRDNEPTNQSCLNIDCITNFFLSKGLSKEKLILGIPTFGRTFTLADPAKTDLGSLCKKSSREGFQGRFTRESGLLSYYEICEKLNKQNWTYVFNDEQKVPYAYKGSEWVGYDNIRSVKLKTQYILDNSLGGAMIWSFDFDDFDGKFCNQGKFPLINTVKAVLEGRYDNLTEYTTISSQISTTTDSSSSTSTTLESSTSEPSKLEELATTSTAETQVSTLSKSDLTTITDHSSTTTTSTPTTTTSATTTTTTTPVTTTTNTTETTTTPVITTTLFTTITSTEITRRPAVLGTLPPVGNAGAKKKIVCYYTNWSQYRPGIGKFVPENVDPSLCTHVIIAFAKINDDSILEPYEWNDLSTEWMVGMFDRMMALKKKNKNLKVLLAAGGWNMGPGPFSKMVHDEAKRKNFVKTTTDFLIKNGFDGFDIDWEYPGSREGSQPDDKIYFSILMRELREAFAPKNLLLAAALAAGIETIEKAYEIEDLEKYLDFANIMIYDLHGAWDTFLGHNAPLYARKDESIEQSYLNVDYVTKYYLSRGLSREKFILGMPLYGRTFKLASSDKTSLGSPASSSWSRAGSAGRFTREDGYLSYYEVCEKLLKDNWVYAFNDEQKIPYAYNNLEWVGFDNLRSIRLKTQYLVDNNLGGAMVWALDTDDFDGKFCNQGKYPLLSTIKLVFDGKPDDRVDITSSAIPSPPITTTTTTTRTTTRTSPASTKMDTTASTSSTTTRTSTSILTTRTSSTSASTSTQCPTSTSTRSSTTTTPAPTSSSRTSSTTSSTTTTETSTSFEFGDSGTNSNLCFNGDGFYPIYEKKCKEYYRCVFSGTNNEMVSYFNCPDGLAFDNSINSCNFPQLVSCQDPSQKKQSIIVNNINNNNIDNNNNNNLNYINPNAKTLCFKGDGFYLRENTNCQQYYFCGLTSTEQHVIFNFTCLNNLRFNLNSRNCEPNASCESDIIGQLTEFGAPMVTSKLRTVCSKGDGVYADTTRGCKFYFECSFIRTKYARYYEMMCPGNTFFNQKTKSCSLKYAC